MIDRCCISITEKCNLRCKYCHFTSEGRRSRDVTDDELRAIVSSIRQYVSCHNTEFKVGIVGGGEPLIRFQMLKYLVEQLEVVPNVRLYTISNGVDVDDTKLRFMWEHKDSLEYCISLDGGEKIHDSNRIDIAGRGTFAKVMETVRKYEDLFGHKPSVNCTVTPQLLSEKEETISFFADNGFEKVTFSKLFDSEDKILSKDFDTLLDEASRTVEIRQLRKKKSYDCTQYGALCGVGRTNVYYASGFVYPCARFAGMKDYCIGSATDSLESIEANLRRITPCKDGLCYYDQHFVKGGIQ